MPIVTVQITNEKITKKQKSAIIQGMTAVLVDILQKSPETTFVIIQEVKLENWGIGGLPVEVYREQRKRKNEPR